MYPYQSLVLKDPAVRRLAQRFFRHRNLLVRIMRDESVPQRVRDDIMVHLGLHAREYDMADFDKAEAMVI